MPAEKTSFTATEIKAGVMVLAAVVILAGFVGMMRGCGTRGEERNVFVADFSSIIGLNLGAEVRFGGVKVGRVIDIGADPESRARIRVTFEVPASIPVNHDSVATIEQISLTTAKHLEISTGSEDAPLHVSGDCIQSYTKDGGFVDIPDLEGVISRMETMLDGIITILGVERARAAAAATGEEMVDLAAVAAALEEVLVAGGSTITNIDATIAENRDDIAVIVDRLVVMEEAAAELLANLNAVVEDNREPLARTAVNLEQLSADGAVRFEELATSLEETLAYLENLTGNASQLVDEHRPTLEQILVNLEATTRSLRRFSQAVAEQPNALVRGAKPQGREDGGSR